jgi:poly-gamma-glutamate capsule biosynthesis protein CapA/YwtB (metallophosphatase superfamily)
VGAPQVRRAHHHLETSITKSVDFLPKGINYRMNPENVGVLTAAAIACCVLANNHMLDFGREGLIETLDTLHRAGIKTAGAGSTLAEAEVPAIIELGDGGRVLVFAFGQCSSGIPRDWAATAKQPGVALLANFSERTLVQLARHVEGHRRPGDILIASVHWGGNWGYDIRGAERGFAHRLIAVGARPGSDSAVSRPSADPFGTPVEDRVDVQKTLIAPAVLPLMQIKARQKSAVQRWVAGSREPRKAVMDWSIC